MISWLGPVSEIGNIKPQSKLGARSPPHLSQITNPSLASTSQSSKPVNQRSTPSSFIVMEFTASKPPFFSFPPFYVTAARMSHLELRIHRAVSPFAFVVPRRPPLPAASPSSPEDGGSSLWKEATYLPQVFAQIVQVMDENRCSGKDSSQKIGSMDAAGGSVQREVVTLLDDDGNEHDIVMKMLSMIQQSVIAESERTRSELKNQNTQIKQLAEASIDHGQAIKTLMACASKNGLGGDAMNYSNAPPKRKGPVTRSLTLKPQENPSRGYMDLEARNMQQESYDNEFMITKKGVTTKKKPGRKPKSSTGYTKAASNMKRKLDFVDEEAAATEEEVIPQDGVGSPFTYNSHNAYHTGMEMPWCLNLIWRPPGNMHFIGSELAVAAYIFANDELESEILISDEHCFVNREALLSLAPGEEVQEEFLNAVAGKLSHGPRGLRWYLPTIFAHMSLVPEEWDADTIDYLRKRYMGKVEDTTKVFIPVHRNMHWFLVVMDIPNKKMIYLDSWKNSGEQAAIMKQIKYLGYFMESVLDDRRFFRSHATPKPKCSDF